jgi:hypothetical protein
MKFTREQAIDLAQQAGFTSDDAACMAHDLTRLCTLASDAALDAAIGVCHVQQQLQPTEGRAVVAACCAASIRDLKEKKP